MLKGNIYKSRCDVREHSIWQIGWIFGKNSEWPLPSPPPALVSGTSRFFYQKVWSKSNMTIYYPIGPNWWPKWPFRIQKSATKFVDRKWPPLWKFSKKSPQSVEKWFPFKKPEVCSTKDAFCRLLLPLPWLHSCKDWSGNHQIISKLTIWYWENTILAI